MARLYSDLADGSGRRYYFGLASAPGGITNAAPATLTLFGYQFAIQEQSTVFRTPATAALSLLGYAAAAEPHLIPAPAALAYGGKIPSLLTLKFITNALPPDYTTLPDNAPIIVYIQTISPTPAALTLTYPPLNVTEGGNIGFISIGKATLTLAGFGANIPHFGEVGTLTINGLVATLSTELRILPDVGSLVLRYPEVLLALPFTWVDEDPPPATAWIDDPPP